MSREEDAEEIFRGMADLIVATRREMPSLVDQERIMQCVQNAAEVTLIARRHLAALQKNISTSIKKFLARYVVTTSVTQSTNDHPSVPTKGRPCRFDSSVPMVRYSELYVEFNKYMANNKTLPVTQPIFSRLMAEQRYVTERVRSKDYYVGIRLRTADDPLPRFPNECNAPDFLVRDASVLTFARGPRFSPSDNGKKVCEWQNIHYNVGDSPRTLIETEELYKRFLKDSGITISKEEFEDCLVAPIFDSFPDECRWTLSSIEQQDLNHFRRRWAALISKI